MLCSGAHCVRNYGILPASIASYHRSVEQTLGQSNYLFDNHEVQKAETITA